MVLGSGWEFFKLMSYEEFVEAVKHLAETIVHDPFPTVQSGKKQAQIMLDLIYDNLVD